MATPSSSAPSPTKRSWATGMALFAGIILVTGGLVQAAQGFSAIAEDHVHGQVDDYLFGTDLSVWGWVHVAIAVLMMAVGVSIMAAKRWAYAVGIGVAAVSIFANFLALPHTGTWGIVLIGLNVAIIWGLCTLFDE